MGHIDLLGKFSYIEVPESDAQKVMRALDGTRYKGREVRCNDADEKGHDRKSSDKNVTAKKAHTPRKPKKSMDMPMETGDWRQFFKNGNNDFKGEEPDFSEEGWAIRKPRKKK